MRRMALALVIAVAASGAYAQKMFKSTMPDGSVVYSEKPMADAKRVDTVAAPPPAAGISVVTPQEKQRAEKLSKERAASAGGPGDGLSDARRQLQQAEAAREAAKEPQAGERLGTAKGGSRLTDEYHARQKELDTAVENARKRVQQLERGG